MFKMIFHLQDRVAFPVGCAENFYIIAVIVNSRSDWMRRAEKKIIALLAFQSIA